MKINAEEITENSIFSDDDLQSSVQYPPIKSERRFFYFEATCHLEVTLH